MSRALFMFTVRFATVLLGFWLVVWLLGATIFSLSRSGSASLEELEAIPAPNRSPRKPQALHHVEEWPASKGEAFTQAPMLRERVESGNLPPIVARLPTNPLVVVPPHQNGPYGGTWTRFATGPGDIGIYDARLAYEGLVRFGPMGRRVLPNLAVRWEMTDGGRSFTFWLRRGVRWSDGSAFTAADIMFWYEDVLQNPDLTPVIGVELRQGDELVRLEKLDDFTIRFRFPQPYGLFLKRMASGLSQGMVGYPAHYLRQFHAKYVERQQLNKLARKYGKDFWYQLFADRRDWSNPEMPRLWAWIVSKPPPARPVVFERNPYYWKVDPDGRQLPYIDRMTFEIHDVETINIKAINGEVGMQGRHITFQNYPLFMTHRKSGDYQVLHWIDGGDGMMAIALNLNHKDPVLKDLFHQRRFRIALSHAMNRNDINEACYMGIGQPRQQSPPPLSDYYVPEYAKAYIEHDPDKANQLLDEVGLDKRNDEGIRLRSDGKPLVLQIETSSTMVGPSRMYEMIADQWTAVGVKTKHKMMARQLFSTRRNALLPDVLVWSGAGEIIPVLDPRWFLPFNVGSMHCIDYMRWVRSNGEKGEQPPPAMLECIDIYRKVERAVDEPERIRLFKQIIELNRQHLWVLGTIGEIPQIFIVNNRFRNVPEVAVACWPLLTPGATAPECYAIEESENKLDG